MPFWTVHDETVPPICLRQRTPKKFQLLTGFRYKDPTTGKVHLVPAHDQAQAPVKGNSSDLASVPPPLWGFIATYGHHTRAALLHDRLCDNARNTAEAGDRKGALAERQEADRIFRVSLAELNVPWIRRWTMFTAVTLATYANYARFGFVALVAQILASTIWFGGALIAYEGEALLIALFLPAAASLIWLNDAPVALVGSYAAIPVLALLLIQLLVTLLFWVPALVEWLLKLPTDSSLPIPKPVPYRTQRF